MLQDQVTIPIMDVVTIDAKGNATEVGTQPLFPVILAQQEEIFIAQIEQLTHWFRDFVIFVAEHVFSPQVDQDGREQEKNDEGLLDHEPKKDIHEST